MSKPKIKVSAVSYLNTIPFIHGMERTPDLFSQIELSRDIPAECARKLLEGEVDLGLIPVAVIPKLEQAHIISDYCIGAVGKVQSVLLLSEVPLHEIETIQLDYQSRTSVQLCRTLCQHFWKIDPQFINSTPGYEESIQGTKAGVVIGDRCFGLKDQFNYAYDLSEAWYEWMKLPFVFAAWVSNKELSPEFQLAFNRALQSGLADLKGAVENFTYSQLPKVDQIEYLEKAIDYELDELKLEGLNHFLSYLKNERD